MLKQYIKYNPVISTILLFALLYFTLQLGKPKYLYNTDGSLKKFGIGYKNKTVFPLWLLTIALSILCYLFVRFCILSYA